MGRFGVEEVDDATQALARAEPFLVGPIEHNLALSILHQRRARPQPGRYWSVVDDGHVVGFALRSPLDFIATLTPMPAEAVPALVDAVIDRAPDLTGVNGEASVVAAFAGHWAERVRVPAVPLEAHRLYRLDHAPAPRPAPGTLRLATEADRDLLVGWARSFQDDVGLPHPGDIAEMTGQRIADGRLWVWDDGGPVSAVGAAAAVAGVARLNSVYTPPEQRRRGYAGACVSALSAHLLATEVGTCVLYAQLANPTANGVYRSIGYRAAAEMLFYRLGPGPGQTNRTRPSP